jgi:hypothetical protein
MGIAAEGGFKMKVVDSKLAFIVMALLCVACATASSEDGLVLHMRFDQGTINNGVATDVSGQGNDGLVTGDPQVVEGVLGDALVFDGIDDFIEVSLQPSITFEQGDSFSVMAWIKTSVHPSLNDGIVGNYRTTTDQCWTVLANDVAGGVTLFLRDVGRAHTSRLDSPDPINTDTWIHVAGVRDQQTKEAYLYVDGEVVVSMPDETENINSGQSIWIGDHLNRYYDGLMDDVRLYNYALGKTEVLAAMEGSEGYPYALGPDPKDGTLIKSTWVTLSWSPGDSAVSHDVYLGEDYDEVSEATKNSEAFRGNQTDTFYVAGFPGYAYPDGLAPGTTYYWRIDEVNEADPNSPWKGDIWSFSIPPKTAYNPIPADGAQFVEPNDLVLKWTPGFGAKLHTVYFGDSFDNVRDASGGAPAGVTTYEPGPLEREKVYYWRVDEFDAAATYTGDVWSFTTPGAVGNPQPAYDAEDVGMNATLSWTPADSAASHQLYFGADMDAVRNADTSAPEYVGPKALGAETHDPGLLDADTSYYWRVDEVDDQGNISTGPIWIFTTGAYLLVDDFESYTDDDPNNEAIWQTWIDGFGVPDNGAQVGYLMPPYAEQTIVHGGLQSMPLFYTNEGGVTNSEATLTLTSPRDWTVAGVSELSVWFRGASGNAADPLYVAVSNSAGASAIVAQDDPEAAMIRSWTQWRIPLQGFADQGINLTNVDKIAVGVGSKGGVAVGGSGTLYVDDIRLYPPTQETQE